MAICGYAINNGSTAGLLYNGINTTCTIAFNSSASNYMPYLGIKASVNGAEKYINSISVYQDVGMDYVGLWKDSCVSGEEREFRGIGYEDVTNVKIDYSDGLYENLYLRGTAVNTENYVTTITGIRYPQYSTIAAGDTLYAGIPPLSAADRYRAMILRNMNPDLNSRNKDLMASNGNPAEMRARKLLRDLVGDDAFRRYLVRGFIVCHGPSGVVYRVHGGHGMVYSFTRSAEGKLEIFERFCVQFKDPALPFTDAVIMRKLLVENDEFGLRASSIVSKVMPEPRRMQSDWTPRPLVERLVHCA